MTESQSDLGGIELRPVVLEPPSVSDRCEQFATGDELHEQIEVRAVLECGSQLDDERVVDLAEQVPLLHRMIHLLLPHDHAPFHDLERKRRAITAIRKLDDTN